MALLPILHYPDPRLRNPASPVEQVDDAVRRLVADMFETMYAAPGIGLAAPQVDVSLRVITIDLSEHHDQPLCLINPVIADRRGTMETEEGCLSVPGVYDFIERAEWIALSALGRSGEALEMEVEGLLAVCIQHEVDHLDGKLFVDHLSRLKRRRIHKRARKTQRQTL